MWVWERICLCERDKEREIFCSGVDKEKKRKKKSEESTSGVDEEKKRKEKKKKEEVEKWGAPVE